MTRIASPIAASAAGDGEHEQGKDLPDNVVQEAREGDEIDVHRKQDQLDRHQDDDHVLAVDEECRATPSVNRIAASG